MSTASAWLLAALFATAGALKLGDPAAFAQDIGHYRLLPQPIAAGLALWLPWFEIALACGLVWPGWRREAALLAGGLLLVFCAALGSVLWRGIDLSCGCFGRDNAVTPAWALARNLAMLALAALAARPKKIPAPPP